MWKNYFKISWRLLLRNRLYTIINLFSLTVGISIFTVILLLFQTKTTKDFFHKDSDQIYRIVAGIDSPGKDPIYTPLMSESFATQCESSLPSLETVAQYGWTNGIVVRDDNSFHEKIQLVDPEFFNFFSFPFKEGKSDFHNDFNSVVLSKDLAQKYFGERSPLNQEINIKIDAFEQTYRVCGVLDSKAYNSKFELDIIIPNVYTNKIFTFKGDDSFRPFENFIKLRADADISQVQANVTALLANEFNNYEEDTQFSTLMQSVKVSSWAEGLPDGGFVKTPLYVFLSLAFIILLISCVNFATLTIGNAFKRTKEVGVRKVNGAFTSQLRFQFLIESVLTAIVAAFISLPIIYQLVSMFNEFTGINILFANLYLTNTLLIYVIVALFSGITAGFYPAFNIAKFNTQNLLKNNFQLGGKSTFSNILITAQFTVSLFFVVLASLISKQVYTFENASTGFNKEHIVLVDNPVEVEKKASFSQNLFELTKKKPGISFMAASTTALSHNDWNFWPYYYNEEEGQYFHYNYIDENFIDLYQIEMVNGRNFNETSTLEDISSVIVNQVFVERYQLENPVGSIINLGEEDVKIVGVTKDFHYRNLKQKINPLVLRPLQAKDTLHTPDILAFKLTGDIQENIAALQTAWNKVAPNYPFEYVFVEDEMNNSYIDIAQIGMIASFASTLVSIVSVLGLFGLIVLVSSKRTKEIAIRKVLCASTSELIWTLSKNLLKLVLIAILIALPLATFFFSIITEQFVVKVPFNFFLYCLVAFISLSIAMITMCLHTMRVAAQNPINNLRHT
ncbi:ABC transporter permease [Chondrinema litorale]|uniref:ABC transporter permease n=1 Tax=Chondrinema litorale TaxID=2994555 RepID=UPI0025434E4A|nr:ABC transporter permease [Chondrinema litorale]UZR99396.1 ABC transporter permease [Chondrinema litorale]